MPSSKKVREHFSYPNCCYGWSFDDVNRTVNYLFLLTTTPPRYLYRVILANQNPPVLGIQKNIILLRQNGLRHCAKFGQNPFRNKGFRGKNLEFILCETDSTNHHTIIY